MGKGNEGVARQRAGERACVFDDFPARKQTAHQIEPRVTECGDGMKNSVINPLAPTEVLYEPNGEKYRADAFQQQRAQKNTAEEAFEFAAVVLPLIRHQEFRVGKAEFAHRAEEQGDESHDAEPAELNQRENDDLTERRPMDIRIERNQARHAGSRGRRKQRFDKGRSAPAARSNREGEQKGSRQNDDEIAQA